MNILVVTTKVPYVHGGAEVQERALLAALRGAGHNAESLALPARSGPGSDQMLRGAIGYRLLDLTNTSSTIDHVIALKFPSWLVRHHKKTVWLVHQERNVFDLWAQGMARSPEGTTARAIARGCDLLGLSDPDARLFTISSNVAQRLERETGLASKVLRPPPADPSSFYSSGRYEDYLLFPSRITALKRQELVLRSLALTTQPVSLVVVGREDQPGYQEQLQQLSSDLGVSDRVRWLNHCTDNQLRSLYASARAVVFPPFDEDFGLITAEAMLSERAVITCTDSGGPLELLDHTRTGLVVPPVPELLAKAIDSLAANTTMAQSLGAAARQKYLRCSPTWSQVVDALLAVPA